MCLLALSQCANPLAPTGGPRDEDPPRVIQEESTPNGQVRFRPEAIELTFDEWVKVQDAFRQIVISPPLAGKYEVKLRKRTVVLSFAEGEVLRDSATYVINFGEAIKDLTEGNPAEDLRFVFSTGDQIDSLTLSGTLADAYTGKAIENGLLLLYENTADSVVRTERPFYFARTNKSGQFHLTNLKPGRFKAAALVDADLNYLYNQATEVFGFLDTLVHVSAENTDSLKLRLSVKSPPMRRVGLDTSVYGRTKLVLNQSASLLSYQTDSLLAAVRSEISKDTLFLWAAAETPWVLRVNYDTIRRDTLRMYRAQGVPPALKVYLPAKPPRHNPGTALSLPFNQPLLRVDTALISLLADTLLKKTAFQLSLDSISPREARLRASWQENKPYVLQILPGAFTSWFGQTNQDTLVYSFSTDLRKNYGNLTLNFDDYRPDRQYVVRVLEKSGREIKTLVLSGQTSYQFEINALASGLYVLEIISDENANGRWDPGDYDLKRQPEPVQIKTLEQLRPNWDLEVDISGKEE